MQIGAPPSEHHRTRAAKRAITGQALSLEPVLELEIADALNAAHTKGIIRRDQGVLR